MFLFQVAPTSDRKSKSSVDRLLLLFVKTEAGMKRPSYVGMGEAKTKNLIIRQPEATA